ncbi:MAG: oxygen-dependent coproporphyrinogen oxidase [Pleurocapsa sp. SU_196_0]|nr:oxygen-dependent coproporphyrinogen oxidase [Pleurocapsa sp. SU_196_0]
MTALPEIGTARDALLELQNRLIARFEGMDGGQFRRDHWTRPQVAGQFSGDGRTCILENGEVIERGGVLFSHIMGAKLPPAASAHRPHLAGSRYEVLGVSVVIHPRNPFAPTAHMNVRRFSVTPEDGQTVAWVGGGMDLTPHYLFDEDATVFHCAAQGVSSLHYPTWKHQCDEYFLLKHRCEARGIGGIFFDDYGEPDGLDIAVKLGNAFLDAYALILERRKDTPFQPSHRDWQLYRRGRYVEFNLVWDRGTTFGLQSNGRIESILASMPPLAAWQYNREPEAGSDEARLLEVLREPRDWV